MVSARRFLFETDFGAKKALPGAVAAARKTEAPAASLLPVDPELLARTRKEGHAAGFAEGSAAARAEAAAEASRETNRLLERLAAQLATLAAEQQSARESRLAEAIGIAAAVLRKLFPELAARHGLDEILALLKDCLARLETAERLTITVAECRREALEQKLEELRRGTTFEGRLLLVGDSELGPADLKLDWGDGGAERDGRRLWTEIEAALQQNLVQIPQEISVNDSEEGA